MSDAETITVAIRVRPLNSKETTAKEQIIVSLDEKRSEIGLADGAKSMTPWTFDYVFGVKTQQDHFYKVG